MHRWIARLAAAVGTAVLTACASPPPPIGNLDTLLAPGRFAPPAQPVSTDHVLDANEAMRRFLQVDMASTLRVNGPQKGLVEALYRRTQLQLEYDAVATKTAAQAFDARSGNCLSLVLMTAAFAKELGVPVRYQSAWLDETWSRSGTLLLASGHVNITLGRRVIDVGTARDLSPLTIDFLPSADIRGLRIREIDEATVLAMYANNRAAEALAAGRLDDAYAWSVESLRRDPSFLSAANTLGVVYLRHGDLADAERVFTRVLAREPEQTRALANLAETYERQGRVVDAAPLRARLAAIEPYPPFHFFDLGLAAARRDDWRLARSYFEREVARADYDHESHYWLGVADFRLGDLREARRHLQRAVDNSVTHGQHTLYAAKLAWLQSRASQ